MFIYGISIDMLILCFSLICSTLTIKKPYLMIEILFVLQEALRCASEIHPPSLMPLFVDTVINQVLERSTQARKQTGQLLHDLVAKKILSQDHYLKG